VGLHGTGRKKKIETKNHSNDKKGKNNMKIIVEKDNSRIWIFPGHREGLHSIGILINPVFSETQPNPDKPEIIEADACQFIDLTDHKEAI
jgi:hypothetical protein